MKRTFTKLMAALALLTFLAVPMGMWGHSVSDLTFTAACGGSGTADDGAVYTVTSDAEESTYDATKGIHYGTSKKAVSYLYLTTDDINGTITKIIVNASGASSTSAVLNVTVGGTAFGSEKNLTSSAAEYTLTGSASGEIVVAITQTSAKKALYCKSVKVTYTSGPATYTVTYDCNGGTSNCPDPLVVNNVPAGNYTLASAPSRTDYTFGGWNDGDGTTTYQAGATYPISQNVTFTAQWTPTFDYINVAPTSFEVPAAGDVIEMTMTTNITSPSYAVEYYTTSAGNETTTKPSWFGDVEFSDNTLDIEVNENEGAARNAYFKVYSGTTYSNIVTVNQAAITVATPEFDEVTGTYYEDQLVGITCTTSGATIYYTTDGTTPAANNGTEYDGNGVEITETTTLKAIAIKNSVSSEVATATYTIIHPLTIAAARTQATGSVTTRGVVTYVSGKNAYIQDATAAICVYGNSNWSNIIVGDDIVVSGTLDTYANGGNLLEIKNPSVTKISSGNPKPYVTKTVAEINTDNFSELQGMFVQIVKAIYDYYNDKVSQNSNEINVYGTMGDAEDGDVVTFKGNITYYNSAIQISNLQDVSIIHEPSITADASLAVPNYILSTPEASIDYEILIVNGTNLEGNITVALENGASSDFELLVSENPDIWGYTMQLTPASGTVSNVPIAVRLKADKSVNGYSDRIVLSSTNAATVYVDVTGSVTYAHVTYDGNGDGVTNVPTDNNDYSYNQEVTVLGAGEMTKEGYDFVRWDTKADGTGISYDPDDNENNKFNITANTTLYAQWDAKSYVITKATMTNGDVIVKVGENVVTSSTTGTTVTLVVAPAANYALNQLVVTKTGDPTTTVAVTNNQFVMPPYPVTVSATFVEYHAYVIDFESAMSTYTNWVYSNITAEQTAITPHGGSKYGKTNGTTTAYIQTKDKIASPGTFVCYISKIGTNTNANSYWKVQYSSDGSTWTTQGDNQAAAVGITEGTWTKIERDLSSRSNVYIRVYYDGTTAVRTIDDISLEYTPAQEYELKVASVAHIDIKAAVGTTDVTEGNTLDVEASKTVNLTVVSEDDDYQFDEWVVYKTGDESTTVTVTNNSFTMPDYAVTVSATTKEVRTITYSVNGTTSSTIYDKGTEVELAAPSSGIPYKFTFVGWTANPAYTADENLVTSYTANENATFYAVFKKENAITITGTDFSGSYDKSEAEVMMQGLTWGRYYVCKQTIIQFHSGDGYFYNKSEMNNLVSIVATRNGTDHVAIKTASSMSGLESASALSIFSTSGYVDTYNIPSGHTFVLITNAGVNATTKYDSFEFRFTGDETRYTRVFQNETATADITIAGPSIIPSGSVLNMGNNTLSNTAAANLIIEDGAQYYGNGVKATMQKVILPYSTEQGDNDKWYAISMPFNYGINPGIDGYMTEMVTDVNSEPTYDFYRFDNIYDGAEWRNFRKNDGFGMTIGQGYLYAHKNGITLNFTGTLNATGENIQSIGLNNAGDAKPFADWFFAGNPFPCNATIDGFADFYVINEVEGKSEFTLSEGGILNPLEGAMIYDQNAAYNMTGSYKITYVPASAPAPSNVSNNTQSMINLSVSRNSGGLIDCARVRFDEGGMLPKFQLNPNNTKLYIPQGTKDYAVVRSANEGEMPVSFKASKNGTYTLSINTENVEMSYLHLFDNKTGADIDLLATPSYSFEAKTTDYASRFRLVFSANEGSNENGSETFAFFNGSEWVISNMGEATLQVVDVMGRVLSSETISGNANVTLNQAAGIYMLRLVNGENVKVQKVVVR